MGNHVFFMVKNMVITFSDLIKLAVVVMALWGFCKIVMEIVKTITARHDREQAWDNTAEKLKEEREEIVCNYNDQLADIRKKQDDIRSDFEAKVQEIKAEQIIIIETLRAVLDGLKQQGCNGRVSEAISNLDEYLNEKAHK